MKERGVMSNPALEMIGFRRLDKDAAAEWFARALKLFNTGLINAWCDDETSSGTEGLLIADNKTADAVADYITRWPRGRLFTEQADLRWEQFDAATIHIVMIVGMQELLNLGITESDILELEREGEPRTLLLWGSYDGKHWREDRIPDIHSYMPNPWQGPYAGLNVQDYRADWPDKRASFRSERRIVRYFAYDRNVNPPDDSRFKQPNSSGATT
jgi:hypothetical protein